MTLLWRIAVVVSLAAALLRGDKPVAGLAPAGVLYVLQFGLVALVAMLQLLAARRDRTGASATLLVAPTATLVVVAAASSLVTTAVSQTLSQVGLFAVVALFVTTTYAKRWSDPAVMRGDLATMFWAVTVVHVIGLAGHFTSQPWAVADYGRYVGLFSNANFAGISAASVLPLALFLRGRSVKAAGVVLLVALYLSDSRGSLLAAIVGLLVMLSFVPAVRSRAIETGWALSVVAVLLTLFRPQSFDFIKDYASRVSQGGDVSSGRFDIYSVLFDRWQQSPWLGTGYSSAEVQNGAVVAAGHNVYLTVLVEMGVLGAAVFAWLILAALTGGSRKSPLLGVLIVVLMLDLTESSLFGFGGPTAMYGWLLLFAYAATGRQAKLEALSGDDSGVGDRQTPARTVGRAKHNTSS